MMLLRNHRIPRAFSRNVRYIARGLAARSTAVSASVDPTAAAGVRITSDDRPFDKILIANRGEISCRVIRTARRMGVKTVAVYSDADDQAPHVRMADEAVGIGPPVALQSYLDPRKILDAVSRTGAQAVHPGYGFLSENATFAESCERAGVAFVGPPSSAIESMGDKLRSKKIAKDAGVNTIPGFEGVIQSGDEAVKLAEDIGYPVMIKASAGGGGKGMRIAYGPDDLRSGFERSTAEAISSFGDGRMLLEKYIEKGHHIEIQVLADSHGNVAMFPERECSVQRRNQKVLEESPSCLINPETRLAMQEQAAMLCKATGYRSAGTVEMICANDLSFYFLEMNTRLQVEHPVTESITDADLVEEMLNIAAGRPMSDSLVKQPHVPFHGHAIEARVYAEDPFRKFLPSIGPLVTYREPMTGPRPSPHAPRSRGGDGVRSKGSVRVDSGIVEGSAVSMFYDPMISKLITFGETREDALDLMGGALDEYVIKGVGHNVPFLRDVVRNRDFAVGNYSTSFIGEHYPEGFGGVVLSEEEELRLAAVAAVVQWVHQSMEASVGPSHNNESRPRTSVATIGGHGGRVVEIVPEVAEELGSGSSVVVMATPVGGASTRITFDEIYWEFGSTLVDFTVDGKRQVAQYLGASGEGYDLAIAGSYQHVIVRSSLEQELSKHMLPPAVVDHSKTLRCPMPGQVVSIAVKEGDEVEEGQQLAVVEAMKMQNVLKAENAGRVAKLKCKPGDTLRVDAVMMEFEFD